VIHERLKKNAELLGVGASYSTAGPRRRSATISD
jgi:hypothetical protein